MDATLAGLIPFSGPLPGVADAIGNAGLNDAIPLGYPKRLDFYLNGISSPERHRSQLEFLDSPLPAI